ncbi:MAG: hypothetical protein OEZ25_01920 [Candidatus Bathyarchaeota archaeon]|nr:hypothetical protein [Candidatus Bathyarchaeota archaeon]
MSERKTQFAKGILIGMGVMLIILGLLGWLTANYFRWLLSDIYSGFGIDITQNYLIERISQLMCIQMGLVVAGLVSLLSGVFGVGKKKIPQKKLPYNE